MRESVTVRDASTMATLSPVADHDHAWRKRKGAPDPALLVGEYSCDLCPAVWSM